MLAGTNTHGSSAPIAGGTGDRWHASMPGSVPPAGEENVRQLSVELPHMKKAKRQTAARPGTIVIVEYEPGHFVQAVCIHSFTTFAFLAPSFMRSESPPAIRASDTMFTIFVMKSAITSGRWTKIGECDPAMLKEFVVPRFFVQSKTNSDDISVYHLGIITPTQRAAVIGLESMAVWSAEHVEDRLRDAAYGRPNKWVELMRLK
jgi:hypothetical protein